MKIPGRSFSFRCGPAWLVLALLALGPGRAAEPVRPPGEEVYSLPPLLVEYKNAPLRWRYIGQPDFEVLTVCPIDLSLDFVRRKHRLDELMEALVARRYLYQTVVPETYVLFNEETNRARSREVIAEMVKAQGLNLAPDGNLEVRQLPNAPEMKFTMPNGRQMLSIKAPEVLLLPNLRLNDRDSMAVFSILSTRATAQTFRYSEDRMQFLLKSRAPALPAWFIAGLLGLLEHADFGEDSVTLLPLVWRNAAESKALKDDPERPRVLLPLAEMLAGRPPAPKTQPTELDEIWAAQCTLFLRWALTDAKGSRRAALEKFVDRLDAGEPTAALFEECFGLGFADARDRLSDYLPAAVARRVALPPPKLKLPPPVASRPATPLEIARLRGGWERQEIPYVRARYPGLVENYLKQARDTLYRAHDTGERDPRLLAELGLTELEGDSPARARHFLEAAVAGGVVRPNVLFKVARLRYAELPADHSELTLAQAAAVLEPLHAALALAPPLPEAYALLAVVFSRSPVPPGPAELARLTEGARLFPGASEYLLRVIYFNLAGGRAGVARELADLGRRRATDPAMQERLGRMQDELAALP